MKFDSPFVCHKCHAQRAVWIVRLINTSPKLPYRVSAYCDDCRKELAAQGLVDDYTELYQ